MDGWNPSLPNGTTRKIVVAIGSRLSAANRKVFKERKRTALDTPFAPLGLKHIEHTG